MRLNGKRVNLIQLQSELAAAGLLVPALGTSGDDLHTYDAQGHMIDLPAQARSVLDAHTPAAPPVAEAPPDPVRALADLVNGLLARSVLQAQDVTPPIRVVLDRASGQAGVVPTRQRLS